MENQGAKAMAAMDSRGSSAFAMENPFRLKFGQVFTGFGVGCGIGIGVGRPIYLGAIPMLQQVMNATRGAIDAFSGVGQHINSSQAVTKLMLNMGLGPSLSSMQSVVPGSFQNSVNALKSAHGGSVQSSNGGVMDFASKNTVSSFNDSKSDGSIHRDPTQNAYEGKGSFDRSYGSCTEKVPDSFLQSPIFKHEEDTEVNELAEKLRAENDVLQVLLRQQQTIQGLMEENRNLQKILVEDLNVSPSKLHANRDSFTKSEYPCSNCFECRQRKRKAGR